MGVSSTRVHEKVPTQSVAPLTEAFEHRVNLAQLVGLEPQDEVSAVAEVDCVPGSVAHADQ